MLLNNNDELLTRKPKVIISVSVWNMGVYTLGIGIKRDYTEICSRSQV